MEEEKEAVEVSDLLTGRVDLDFFERETVEDELFLFQPLLQQEFVGWGLRDLVERMQHLRLHY